MEAKNTNAAKPVWIQGPRLRQRWDMSNSSFYAKLKEGRIPRPHYPFGDSKPYWRMEEIERFEAGAAKEAA